MNNLPPINWTQVGLVMLLLFGLGLTGSLAMLGWIAWRIKRIDLPPDADVLTALRATPLPVVIALDLLDMTLDILAAPFSWVLLGYLGLKPLREVTLIEVLIPGTQFLPTMTAAWLVVRLLDRQHIEFSPSMLWRKRQTGYTGWQG